jgi:cytochrome P450
MHEPPYFDQSRGAWVLTRYADVTAALRDPQLWPVAARGEDHSATRDELGRLRLRGPSQEALSAVRTAEWLRKMEPLTCGLLNNLETERPVDLLSAYAQPWCSELAFLILDTAAAERGYMSALGNEVFAATGAADDSPLRTRAAAATLELECLLKDGRIPMGEPTFVATSQTLPRLLAAVWVSLYRHPGQADHLRVQPELWQGAVEELLRFAGIVRRIWRQAREAVELGGVQIDAGQRLMLMLADANRDPDEFPEPDRLDVTRRVPAQFALGAGRNSCAGGAVVRLAMIAATKALLTRFPGARLCREPEWRTGSGYRFPESVPVKLGCVAGNGAFT